MSAIFWSPGKQSSPRDFALSIEQTPEHVKPILIASLLPPEIAVIDSEALAKSLCQEGSLSSHYIQFLLGKYNNREHSFTAGANRDVLKITIPSKRAPPLIEVDSVVVNVVTWSSFRESDKFIQTEGRVQSFTMEHPAVWSEYCARESRREHFQLKRMQLNEKLTREQNLIRAARAMFDAICSRYAENIGMPTIKAERGNIFLGTGGNASFAGALNKASAFINSSNLFAHLAGEEPQFTAEKLRKYTGISIRTL